MPSSPKLLTFGKTKLFMAPFSKSLGDIDLKQTWDYIPDLLNQNLWGDPRNLCFCQAL